MKHTFLFVFFFLLLNACESNKLNEKFRRTILKASDYKNKQRYSATIGDTIEIYYSTNSCCKYCQPNAASFKHLEYIGQKIVIPEPNDCEGCNHTTALLFVAKSKGIDTIRGGIIAPLENCNDSTENLDKFVVEVRI